MKLTLAKILARIKVDLVSTSCFVFNFLPASGDFCCLLITFANRLFFFVKTKQNIVMMAIAMSQIYMTKS